MSRGKCKSCDCPAFDGIPGPLIIDRSISDDGTVLESPAIDYKGRPRYVGRSDICECDHKKSVHEFGWLTKTTDDGRRLPFFSKAFFITIPLAIIVLFLPPNSKSVDIPTGVHQFVAIVVAALGSPRLRWIAIGVIAIATVILILGSLVH